MLTYKDLKVGDCYRFVRKEHLDGPICIFPAEMRDRPSEFPSNWTFDEDRVTTSGLFKEPFVR